PDGTRHGAVGGGPGHGRRCAFRHRRPRLHRIPRFPRKVREDRMSERPIRAILWDFGGVITESPFDAFARHERETGLPDGFLRGLNTRNPDSNAWARFERSEVDLDAFCTL